MVAAGSLLQGQERSGEWILQYGLEDSWESWGRPGELPALGGGIWIALVRAGAVKDRSCKGRSGRGGGVALCPGGLWWWLLDRSCKGRSGPGSGFCSMDWRALGSPGGRPGELPALGGGIWIALVRAGAVADRSCKGRSGRAGGVALCPGDVWWWLLDRSCKGRSGPGNGFCSMDWRALGSPGGRWGRALAAGMPWVACVGGCALALPALSR